MSKRVQNLSKLDRAKTPTLDESHTIKVTKEHKEWLKNKASHQDLGPSLHQMVESKIHIAKAEIKGDPSFIISVGEYESLIDNYYDINPDATPDERRQVQEMKDKGILLPTYQLHPARFIIPFCGRVKTKLKEQGLLPVQQHGDVLRWSDAMDVILPWHKAQGHKVKSFVPTNTNDFVYNLEHYGSKVFSKMNLHIMKALCEYTGEYEVSDSGTYTDDSDEKNIVVKNQEPLIQEKRLSVYMERITF